MNLTAFITSKDLTRTRGKVREPNFEMVSPVEDRLCGLVVRVLGYRSGGPGSIPGTTKKNK
jgi:hypothetical protein